VQEVAAFGTPDPTIAEPNFLSQHLADDEFARAQKTPLPNAPLPLIAAAAGEAHAAGNWPPPPLAMVHPPDSPAATDPAATPAASAGSLFGNVATLPGPLFPVAHAEAGLSKLTGLAALAHRHRHLKYVVAASVVVVLVILVILFSWRGETAKGAPPAPEPAAPAQVAPSVGEAEPPPQDEPTVAPEAAPKGRAAPRGGSRRSAPAHAAGPSAKPAAVGEDPFEAASPASRVVERRVPVVAPSQSRGSAGNAGREVSQEQIGAVVRNKENQAGLKTCYERALRRDGRLRTGRLDITVSVGEGGTVQRVQVHGPTDFLIIDGCLKNAIRHWRFPANAEEYATSFPLILQGG